MPCAKKEMPLSLLASSSNTLINSPPIILRFVSGADTPFNKSKKQVLVP